MNDTTTRTTLERIRQPAPNEAAMSTVSVGLTTLQGFELAQRAAKALAASTLVPAAYRAQIENRDGTWQENPAGLPNCIVALNMAQRMGADPLMVMQNLYIVEGRPSWSSQFIIAAINACGRYSSLRFTLSEPEAEREVAYNASEWQDGANGRRQKVQVSKKVMIRNRTCVAWAIEKETGERLESPIISIEMAVQEGWLTKSGSKWQTMPEMMLRYRAASFFGKLYAPELLMGLQTAEEAGDIIDAQPDGRGGYAVHLDALRQPAAQPVEADTSPAAATEAVTVTPTEAPADTVPPSGAAPHDDQTFELE